MTEAAEPEESTPQGIMVDHNAVIRNLSEQLAEGAVKSAMQAAYIAQLEQRVEQLQAGIDLAISQIPKDEEQQEAPSKTKGAKQ